MFWVVKLKEGGYDPRDGATYDILDTKGEKIVNCISVSNALVIVEKHNKAMYDLLEKYGWNV